MANSGEHCRTDGLILIAWRIVDAGQRVVYGDSVVVEAVVLLQCGSRSKLVDGRGAWEWRRQAQRKDIGMLIPWARLALKISELN